MGSVMVRVRVTFRVRARCVEPAISQLIQEHLPNCTWPNWCYSLSFSCNYNASFPQAMFTFRFSFCFLHSLFFILFFSFSITCCLMWSLFRLTMLGSLFFSHSISCDLDRVFLFCSLLTFLFSYLYPLFSLLLSYFCFLSHSYIIPLIVTSLFFFYIQWPFCHDLLFHSILHLVKSFKENFKQLLQAIFWSGRGAVLLSILRNPLKGSSIWLGDV